MLIEHELDLLENAVDSLNEALRKYQESTKGDLRAYKYAILHFAHFIELLFKYYVTQAHPLLVYKKPFSKNLQKEQTIGLWESVQFLKNEGKTIEASFFNDMEWLKELRNNIEHYKFTMDVAEVRRTLGRLTQAIIKFSNAHADIDLHKHIDSDTFKIFEELADEHKAALANAKKEAEEESSDGEVYDCHICWSEDTATKDNDKFTCKLCGEDDIETECSMCNEIVRSSEGIIWNDDHLPHIDYICEDCSERFSNF